MIIKRGRWQCGRSGVWDAMCDIELNKHVFCCKTVVRNRTANTWWWFDKRSLDWFKIKETKAEKERREKTDSECYCTNSSEHVMTTRTVVDWSNTKSGQKRKRGQGREFEDKRVKTRQRREKKMVSRGKGLPAASKRTRRSRNRSKKQVCACCDSGATFFLFIYKLAREVAGIFWMLSKPRIVRLMRFAFSFFFRLLWLKFLKHTLLTIVIG